MQFAAGAASALLIVGVLRALVTGSAMAGGGGFDRDEEPITYWAIVILGAIAASVLLAFAIFS